MRPNFASIRARPRPPLRTLLTGVLACFLLLGGCRAEQQNWPLWEHYTRQVLDGQGRVVDHSAGDRTTSEGEAYAMFFALVANDRTHFDQILAWTEANLAGGDLTLRLPAWSWGRSPDGSWKVLDPNSASDADLWMAYSLLEAGRLWREPRYEKLGQLMAARIAQTEVATVPALGRTLLPGSTGFHPDGSTWVLNPSYLPPPLLLRLGRVVPGGPWADVLQSLTPMLRAADGFAMDWVASSGGTVRPALAPAQISSPGKNAAAVGSYDAIRVYLWLGMSDRDTPGLRAMLDATRGMAEYLKQALTPPLAVSAIGEVLNPEAPAGFSAAVAPFLAAKGMRAQQKVQMDRVSALRDPQTGLIGREGLYYDQNLTLFGSGWAEGRYRFDREGRLVPRWR